MTTETEITPELQGRIADALGLPLTWKTETAHGANSPTSATWHFEDFTTGDGMLRLLGAMASQEPSWHFQITTHLGDRIRVWFWRATNEEGRWSGEAPTRKLPDALLLAAAKALGVDVGGAS